MSIRNSTNMYCILSLFHECVTKEDKHVSHLERTYTMFAMMLTSMFSMCTVCNKMIYRSTELPVASVSVYGWDKLQERQNQSSSFMFKQG